MKPLAVIADMDGALCDVRQAERYVETGGWDAKAARIAISETATD